MHWAHGIFVFGIFSTSTESDQQFRKWLKTGPDAYQYNMEFYFVHGNDDGAGSGRDVIILNISNGQFVGKSFAWFKMARSRFPNATHVFKMDSDTNVCPESVYKTLNHLHSTGADYIGQKVNRGQCGGFPYCPGAQNTTFTSYMQGGFYGVSRRALDALERFKFEAQCHYEDVEIGRALYTVMRPKTALVECLENSPCDYATRCPVKHCRAHKERASQRALCL